jgi:hypothetical protein
MPNQNDIRQAITDQIISALESGNVLLWRCPKPGPHRQPRTSLSVTGSPTLSPSEHTLAALRLDRSRLGRPGHTDQKPEQRSQDHPRSTHQKPPFGLV